MEIYKLGLVSDTWTSQVRNRILREMLTIDRLARRQGLQLILASNHDITQLFAGVVEVTIAEDLVGCDTFRVYIDYDNKITSVSDTADPLAVLDRLPEDADYELIELNKGKRLPGLVIEKDPYAGALPPDKDVQIIQPTIDLDMPPPVQWKGSQEYNY